MEEKKYFPQLDSLRAIACFCVILFHSATESFFEKHHLFEWFGGGFLGVDLFFVLSGFLITSILVKQYAQYGKIFVLNFYYKRALRLYPPILIAVLVFLVPLLFIDKPAAISNMFFVMTYTGDMVMVFRKFLPSLQYPMMFGHCWSLSIEEQFYLIFPSLLILCFRIFAKSRYKQNLISSFPFFNILFVVLILVANKILGPWFYKFFLWRFFEIFFGSYISFIYSKHYDSIFKPTKLSAKIRKTVFDFYSNKWIYILAVIVFLLSICTISFGFLLAKYKLHYYFFAVASSILIVAGVQGKYKMVNKILENKKLVYLGKISYGLYLYHAPLFYLNEYFKTSLTDTFYGSIALDIIRISAVILLSILSYELVEKFVLRFKEKEGELEFEDMAFVLHSLRPGDLFADIGANTGRFTILASKQAGASVLATEPLPGTLAQLRENIDLNQLTSSVSVLPYVIGSGKEAKSIWFTQYKGSLNHVAGVDELLDRNYMVEIPVRKLDEILENSEPAILKMDIEGFEWPALNGALNILSRSSLKGVIIELTGLGKRYGYSDDKVHELLLSQHFRPYKYNPFLRRLEPMNHYGKVNTIYIRDMDWIESRIKSASKYKILDYQV